MDTTTDTTADVTRDDLLARLPSTRRRVAIRVAADISRARVARHLGVSYDTLKLWEKGATTPNDAHLAAYVELLEYVDAANKAGEKIL